MDRQKLLSQAIYALIIVAAFAIGLTATRIYPLIAANSAANELAELYQGKVVLYGTATCPYCAQARAWLQERRIEFVDLDLDSSPKAREQFKRLGGRSVPLILVQRERIEGFDAEAIGKALGVLEK